MPARIEPESDARPVSLLTARRASSLKHLAREIEDRHGPARAGAGQPESVIDRAARKLGESDGDFSVLDERESKAALELFWRRSGPWIARPADIAKWLGWAEAEWKPRIAETRACGALLRHFDPDHPATAQLCRWLAERQDQLWGRFGEFARRRLFDGAEAAESAGAALAAGDLSFLDEIDRNAHARIMLQATGFIVALVLAFARQSSRRTDDAAWSAGARLLDLLGPRGLKGAGGPDSLRRDAKVAMISGLVRWAVARATADTRETASALSIRLAGDPRESLDDWRDVPEDMLAQVEKWLVEPTLAAAFRIVAELKTDDAASLQKREKFWRAYLPYATRARLIGARKARDAASRLGEPCAALNTYLSDHCGFLLEVRGESDRLLRVVEMNNLAQTMFWPDVCAKQPVFGEKGYDGSQMRASCETFLSHLPPDSWTAKFAELITLHTGIGGE